VTLAVKTDFDTANCEIQLSSYGRLGFSVSIKITAALFIQHMDVSLN